MVTSHWERGCVVFGYSRWVRWLMFFPLGEWVSWLLPTRGEGVCFLVTTCLWQGCSSCFVNEFHGYTPLGRGWVVFVYSILVEMVMFFLLWKWALWLLPAGGRVGGFWLLPVWRDGNVLPTGKVCFMVIPHWGRLWVAWLLSTGFAIFISLPV